MDDKKNYRSLESTLTCLRYPLKQPFPEVRMTQIHLSLENHVGPTHTFNHNSAHQTRLSGLQWLFIIYAVLDMFWRCG